MAVLEGVFQNHDVRRDIADKIYIEVLELVGNGEEMKYHGKPYISEIQQAVEEILFKKICSAYREEW